MPAAPVADPQFDPNQPLDPALASCEAADSGNAANDSGNAANDSALRIVSVDLPLFDGVIAGYCSDHLDVRLSPAQAVTLRRLALGLDQSHARLADGRLINVRLLGDTIRWLLDQLTPAPAAADEAA